MGRWLGKRGRKVAGDGARVFFGGCRRTSKVTPHARAFGMHKSEGMRSALERSASRAPDRRSPPPPPPGKRLLPAVLGIAGFVQGLPVSQPWLKFGLSVMHLGGSYGQRAAP